MKNEMKTINKRYVFFLKMKIDKELPGIEHSYDLAEDIILDQGITFSKVYHGF